MTKINFQSGSAIALIVIVSGFFIMIAVVLSAIFLPKLRTAGDIKKSSPAAFAAESAIEWCLYVRRNVPPQPTPAPPVMSNGATYLNGATGLTLVAPDCLAPAIKVLGTYQGISRAFEISF